MKNRGLLNPFPFEVRELYVFNYKCFNCGKNQSIELHHIYGRVSDSAFNACPLCHFCHERVKHTVKEHQFLFYRNLEFLLQNNYKPISKDFEFIEEHQELIDSPYFEKFLGKKS